ncbi:hypothetical protein QYE76_047356 [Lolium multiflorum]|uniref:CCHC-type domain-containing protein n=1 Tax=Lolium multiflorum TaxID=4521 RepID=A0AAD8X1W0_LOLMU|nr:hypothetical protein QYE76_047356 [Lolium multiflorum]
MLAMTGHAKKLSDLGIVIPNRLGINRVLQSLPPSYKNFVMNYNMQNMNKELPELFGMLKAAEIKKEHQVLMVNKTTSFKKQGKSKGKFKKGGKKAATPPMKPKNGPKPDAECYYCKEKGHWKRNCSKYLADLKSGLVKKKKEVSWASSKQCTVAKSSTESEYIAASEASSEARSSAGLLHRHRHHAVVLSDSRGATTSAARWNGEVDVVFINNRTCDRVRRCCPFVAPEPIVIKIFYALCKRQVIVYRSNKSLLLKIFVFYATLSYNGNHDHPGSKLKNFQNTNPPMFSKTEEPLDADDWPQTMENKLEVAGVEAAEKVLFSTHYLSGSARAWWTSACAMNAGQMMTWEDFKTKFSKYHVPQGLIKKMRDEFRELKQGRMSVVEYRDRRGRPHQMVRMKTMSSEMTIIMKKTIIMPTGTIIMKKKSAEKIIMKKKMPAEKIIMMKKKIPARPR